MDIFKGIMDVLPETYRSALSGTDGSGADELRLRVGFPPMIVKNRQETVLPLRSGPVQAAELEMILSAASGFSAYAVQQSLREGFLTLPGGHRIGVCGTVVERQNEAVSIREVSSLCIRFAREIAFPKDKQPVISDSTLILGPPCSGKTTLLRACIRMLSENGACVSVADARGELSGCVRGSPQFSLGSRSDVLCGGQKAASVMQLLRTMAPQWIALDEITEEADLRAVEQASYCGVKLLATAHADCLDDLHRRPLYRRLLELRIFRNFLLLRPDRTFTEERMDNL